METKEEANGAIESFNETDLKGRSIVVNVARERDSLPIARVGSR